MLPLAGSIFPDSAAALTDAIRAGLQAKGLVAREIDVAAATFPALENLRLDLTGAHLTRDLRMPSAGMPSGAELHVAELRVTAAPLFFENAAVELELAAGDARLAFARDLSGGLSLALTAAAHGTANVAVERAALEQLAQTLLADAASKQGLQIKQTRLELSPRGPRSVGFRAEVTAKMFVMSAKVAVTGNLEIDDQFNARLSNLSSAGEGMIASAANALLKPHFHRLEGRTISLLSFSLGSLRLRDLSIETGETLRVRARFGERAD